jgi:DNA replication and repair protein RecF
MDVQATELALHQFRNYGSARFSMAERTVIVGPNAAGKTNLLEALYLIASGKSFRADRESEMVRWGETAAQVRATFEADDDKHRVTALLSATGRSTQKTFLVNNHKHRARELSRRFPMVLFSADDTRLIDGSPGRRRRAIDLTLAQGSVEYRDGFSRYGRALASRNRLLERIAAGEAGRAELEAWDRPLAEAGQTVTDGRLRYFDRIARPLRQAYGDLTEAGHSGAARRLTATYRPLTTDLGATLAERREQDVAVGTTTAGPHRDDWTLLLDNRPISSFGSGGEYRSAALSWRLAEADWLTETAGARPLLLLDDVFSELDAKRRDALLAHLPAGQTIITTPTADILPKDFVGKARIIEIAPKSARKKRHA